MTLNTRIIRSLGSAFACAGLALLLIVTTTGAQTQTGISFTATSANVSQPGDPVKINLVRWSTDEERNAIVTAMTAPPPRAAAAADNSDPFGTFRGGGAATPPPANAAAAAGARGAPPAAGGAPPAGGRGGRGGDGAAARPPFDPIAALTTALGKATTLGYIWTNTNTGHAIKYAYRFPQPDGTERIILATNRRLGAFNPSWNLTATSGVTDYTFTVIEIKLDAKGLGEGKTSLNTKVIVDAAAKTVALENYAATAAILGNVKR